LSIDALAYALDQFRGTLIFISHDVYLIRALANHVVHVNAGRLTHYPGGYQYYLDKTKAESERAGLTASGQSGNGATGLAGSRRGGQRREAEARTAPTIGGDGISRKEQKRLEAEERQARSRRRKAQQQLVQRLEQEIHQLEARQAELVAELEKPETYDKPGHAVEVNRELLGIQDQLAQLTPEWEREATRLAEIESLS
jgi:ATP-binding cassette subfamily F protein 3